MSPLERRLGADCAVTFGSGVSVAVVGEWLAERAGSEQVFTALAEVVPRADLFALSAAPHLDWSVDGRPVRTTVLDHDLVRDRRALTLPVMPLVWRTFRPGDYDLVITSSHAAVKGFWPGRAAVHLSYVHTPMRYAWWPEIDTRGAGPLLAPARRLLRRWDRRSARWVDSIATNSSVVASRIAEVWGRDAEVIPPPVLRVDPDRPVRGREGRAGVIALGRLVPYKRFDLAIEACRLLGVPLTIAGRGPEEGRLRALAGDNPDVHFVIGPDDDTVDSLLASAAAMVFCGEEDFGIVPVEALAFGTPVCAFGRGGACDTVSPDVNGVHFPQQSAEVVADALADCLSRDWDHEAVAASARAFSDQSFRHSLARWISSTASAHGVSTWRCAEPS